MLGRDWTELTSPASHDLVRVRRLVSGISCWDQASGDKWHMQCGNHDIASKQDAETEPTLPIPTRLNP